ncbi:MULTISPECIES: EAL domain-containing protein [Methylococcus]|uniref:EAL domain-containing protein n=1 Tax=Methylococcus capsulatus TaxID=414 RepID=A0ABZ2F2L6_METCP|nr:MULTISPECIES: EAL domain-containing protein [Methylococcus]MDF9392250.1 EAL domain-containing protein [Methylococcus capsulatus]
MPLSELVNCFNQKLKEEQRLSENPLELRGNRVEGRFGDARLNTELHPVRLAHAPSMIVGHDASLKSTRTATSGEGPEQVYALAEDGPPVVNLDRLCRTIHMLNFLPIAHDDGSLFLHVHPRHILGVKRNHGAYFEDVIFRCGLSPRRVVITVQVTPVYDRQFVRLLEGLKSYRAHGYGTAIKFDENSDHAFLERYCIEFLYRFAPDFVRLDTAFLARLNTRPEWAKRSQRLPAVMRGLDTQFLLEGVETKADAALARIVGADLVKGGYYEGTDARKHQPHRAIA